MGADIHIVVEEKHEDEWFGIFYNGGPFQNFDAKSSPFWKFSCRNYHFFGALANVRTEGPEPNGTPDNASPMALKHIRDWGGDGHSHGHLPLEEFVKRWLEANPDTAAEAMRAQIEGGSGVRHLLNLNDWDEENLDGYRVVFWFDN